MAEHLGSEVVADACSEVADDAPPREQLAEMLEEMTRERCIATGRAMGRLHPAALARFYLATPAEVRAARRGCLPAEIEERDRRDTEQGRLLPADIDALILDTGARDPDELADRAMALSGSGSAAPASADPCGRSVRPLVELDGYAFRSHDTP